VARNLNFSAGLATYIYFCGLVHSGTVSGAQQTDRSKANRSQQRKGTGGRSRQGVGKQGGTQVREVARKEGRGTER